MTQSQITGIILVQDCLKHALYSCWRKEQHFAQIYLEIARARLQDLIQELRDEINPHGIAADVTTIRLRGRHRLPLILLLNSAVQLSGLNYLQNTTVRQRN